MANTTNFGWETPDDTDLVKDGAAAMRTLGGAIDTSLVDLKGGTTDQVLAKNSDTDMDFKWVASSSSPLTTKGDLFTYSTADARLAVGNNGDTLVADSSASTGLRWQEPKAGNPVINSSFQVWQRGTSLAISNGATTYLADRWAAYRGATGSTVSRQTTSDTTNLPNIQYCARVQRDSGNTSTSTISYYNIFESVNSIPYAGKTVTFSFYARAGANYSQASSGLTVVLKTGTGTDQNVYSGFTGASNAILQTATLTTTWQRFSYSATLATTATQIATGFEFAAVGTAGAADYFEVTGVQLEVGSVATPFKTQGVTLAGEYDACCRYYQKLDNPLLRGFAETTTGLRRLAITFKTEMRVAPSVTLTGTLSWFDGTGTGNFTALSATYSNVQGLEVDATAAVGTTAANRPIGTYTIAGAGSLGVSAEL